MPKLDVVRRVYAPQGVEVPSPLPPYGRVPDAMCARLYASMKRDMKAALAEPGEKSFATKIESDLASEPIVVKFVWKGSTAGVLVWGREVDGKLAKLEGVTALLTRLDAQVEAEFLDKLQSANPVMQTLPQAAFDEALGMDDPLMATFFTNEAAIHDSLINAVTMVAATAFFDQFGMVEPGGKVFRMEFRGLIFVPQNPDRPVDLQVMMLPEAEERAMFDRFNQNIKDGGKGKGFMTGLTISGDPREICIHFVHVGATAAFFMLTQQEGDDVKHIHGLTALLTKLDPEEDQQAIDMVRQYKALGGIKQESFDLPLKEPTPVFASFFADVGSANYPPLHTVIKILSAAYFSQFGIGSEAES